MKKVSEQLVGYLWVSVIVALLISLFLYLNKDDHAREQTKAQREHVRFVQDSIQHEIEAREKQREEWAKIKDEREQKKKYWERKKHEEEHIEINLHTFDPNLADSSELVHLGIPPWMARSIEHYRQKKGRFRKPEDFRKTYGMTDSLFAELKPYISISDSFRIDSISRPQFVSNKKDTIIEINTADTTLLKMIRGIGSYTARQIIWRRDALGGFYSLQQLREIEAIKNADGIIAHLVVDSTLIKKLDINNMSVEAMQRHPYIRFEQAKAIRDQRHKHGPISKFELLQDLETNGKKVFSEDDLRRLEPYLMFTE